MPTLYTGAYSSGRSASMHGFSRTAAVLKGWILRKLLSCLLFLVQLGLSKG